MLPFQTFEPSTRALCCIKTAVAILLLGCHGSKQYFGIDPSGDDTNDTVSENDPIDSLTTDTDLEDGRGSTDSLLETEDTEQHDSESELRDTDEPATDTVTDSSDPSDTGHIDTSPEDTEDTNDTENDADSDIPTDDPESDPIDTALSDSDTEFSDTDSAVTADTDEHLDSEEVPSDVPEVQIEINDVARGILEADPFNGPDVVGGFIDESGKRYDVELNYRGAYALQSLISMNKAQRNWKIKFAKTDTYRNRREWNFNYEPAVRQKLAYDLLKFAGVKMPSPRHVRMLVNGEDHGVYLAWEDPDSKDWLLDMFGDDEGDLYKAAYDIPNETKYFADLTFLGDADEDYFYHFDKKTNNDVLPDDYSMLRGFVYDLNFTPDDEFVDWMDRTVTWDSFITYLAVSNFISNWDGYPQRPKNYWLYNNPTTTQWTFIPWDLDNTFQIRLNNLNQMGTDASIFYQFDEFEPYGLQEGEGTERPLVRRMMTHPEFRDAYITRYKELTTSILDAAYIIDRAARLTDLVLEVANQDDSYTAGDAESEIQDFVTRRSENVAEQLSAY